MHIYMIYEVAACAGAVHVESPGRSALRETTSLLPVVAGGYCWLAHLMQDIAGHFDPIHPDADANTRGRNAMDR